MRVGSRIREVLALLDEHGALSRREAWRFHGGFLTLSNVNKYLDRAEKMGLAICDRTVHPQRYTAVKGWQEIARPQTRPAPKPRAYTTSWGAHNPFGGCYFTEQGEADRLRIEGGE